MLETDAVQGLNTVEYIEYYRIIRERVWLLILGAVLAGLVVVGIQLVSGGMRSYTAEGTVLVHPVAMPTMLTQGDELVIAQEKEFWPNLLQMGSNPDALGEILKKLKLPPEAEDQYKITITAKQIRDSRFAVFSCSASRRQTSIDVAKAGMELWDEVWREEKIREAQSVIDGLRGRLPMIAQRLQETQARAEAIEAKHGGLAPAKEAESIEASLAAVQMALQNANLETAAAKERSKALATQPSRTPNAPNFALVERIDDLKQQIMEREVLLADMLERRTRDHPSVLALQRQIDDMRKRVATLEKAEAVAQQESAFVQESAIAAQTYAQEMAARSELLAAREGELRNRLSAARTDLVEYEKLSADATALQKRYLTVQESLRSAEAELRARRDAEFMLKTVAEPRIPREEGLLKQFAIRLGLALFGGAGLGIIAIFLLHYTDTTFKNEEDAERLLGCPVLGGIPHSDVQVIEESPATGPPREEDQAGTG
ncbi:MAG: hypothetical protein HPY44_13005 [Armatimonadetes bacterium]|nr:hypothetical protein [Armatimonadota bacterium]